MHVLYLNQYFAPPDGSGGNRAAGMARRLVKAGHRVTLISSRAYFPKHYKFTEPTTRLDIEGVEVRVIDVPYSNWLSYAARIRAFASFAFKAAVETTRVSDVDVVFATSTPLTIALPGIWAKLWHRKPMVFEVRDLWPELPIAIGALRNPAVKWLAHFLEARAYKNANHIIALSPGMKDGILRVANRPVTTIPNSCDREHYRRTSSAGESFLDEHPHLRGSALVTYAGTLGDINGVEYLAEIAAKMLALDPTVRFLVIGDGKQREAVEARARSLGVLGRNFWMLPPVLRKDMPRVLSASTLAVSLFIDLPEMWHNSANKFFDALAAGKPVMINYQGWQAEVVRAAGAGLVAPPNDPGAAARLLHEFLSEPERVRKAGEAAARLADTEFNRDRLFREFLKVLETARAT